MAAPNLFGLYQVVLALQAPDGEVPASGPINSKEDGEWLWPLIAILAGVIAGILIHWAVFAALSRLSRRTGWESDDLIVKKIRGPSLLALILLGVLIAARYVEFPWSWLDGLVKHGLGLGLIITIIWAVIAILGVAEQLILKKHRVDVEDNLEARRLHTQVRVISRTLVIIVVVVGAGAMLMTFERVQTIGASLLASAGIGALAVGLAARPMLSNLIAGIQLALTQPIRIDDVVVVEGEWGRIEEITATYVVVRIWDLRRLVIPLSYFIEKPIQNWTRRSAEVLGTIYFHTDYSVPLDVLREELQRIVKASPHWDGKTASFVVTDAGEHTMQIRALISAADSSKQWNLRCEVREKIIAFLQREYPRSLPRFRAEIQGDSRPSGRIHSGPRRRRRGEGK